MSEEQDIRNADRIREFLEDPIITELRTRLRQKVVEEFGAAKGNIEQLRFASARLSVLEDFEAFMQGVVNRGDRAKSERTRRERMEAQSQPLAKTQARY